MERLTVGGTGEAKSDVTIQEVLNKLKYYEDLEEQGRLIELPCKVGDTVYASIDFDNKIFDGKVKSLEYDEVKKCWLAEILFQNDFVMKK